MKQQYKCNERTFDTLREAKRYRASVVGGRDDVVVTSFRKEIINEFEPHDSISNIMWVPHA